MKLPCRKKCALSGLIIVSLFHSCTLDDGDQCKETKADPINVNIKIYAHNLVRNAPNVKILVEKLPCGEGSKGQFDLTGIADQFGDYESTVVNYNLDNTNDKINVGYDYLLSDYHGGEGMFGSVALSYSDLMMYDGGTYVLDLEYYPEIIHSYWNAWKENQTAITFCYDLPYYILFGYPPPLDETATDTKSKLYQKLLVSGYHVSAQGELNSSVYIQDGDIILFGTAALPDPANAQHYAIGIGNSIWEILHWSEGGEFDGPRDPAYFLNRPKMQNPYTGVEEEPLVPFLYYMIFSK